MDLRQLQALGAFVSRDLHKRTITFTYRPMKPRESWADPAEPEFEDALKTDTAEVYIRRRNSADFYEMVKADERDKVFVVIFRCVCNPDGSPLFESVEQASNLAEWMTVPLIAAVNEVNNYQPGKSKPRTSSGATSRSASAGVRSASGKKRSAKKSARSG